MLLLFSAHKAFFDEETLHTVVLSGNFPGLHRSQVDAVFKVRNNRLLAKQQKLSFSSSQKFPATQVPTYFFYCNVVSFFLKKTMLL